MEGPWEAVVIVGAVVGKPMSADRRGLDDPTREGVHFT